MSPSVSGLPTQIAGHPRVRRLRLGPLIPALGADQHRAVLTGQHGPALGAGGQVFHPLGLSARCEQRNRAARLPLSLVRLQSRTCVVLPRWTGSVLAWARPQRAAAKKFDFNSVVVKPVAPSLRQATAEYPQGGSARGTRLPVWRKPLGRGGSAGCRSSFRSRRARHDLVDMTSQRALTARVQDCGREFAAGQGAGYRRVSVLIRSSEGACLRSRVLPLQL
jgi:hypothetical protein